MGHANQGLGCPTILGDKDERRGSIPGIRVPMVADRAAPRKNFSRNKTEGLERKAETNKPSFP
jgi:hypothetical protein